MAELVADDDLSDLLPFPYMVSSLKDLCAEHAYGMVPVIEALRMRNLPGSDLEVETDPGNSGRLMLMALDHWDTTRPIPPCPEAPAERTANDTRLRVGTFNDDLPESPKKQAAQNTAIQEGAAVLPYRPEEHRRKGAPAYLRPGWNHDMDVPIFQLVNGLGGIANTQYLQLDPVYPDLATAKGESAIHYDRIEMRRIRRYNTRLAVYFARQRFRYWAMSGNWPFPDPNKVEDFTKFRSPDLLGQRLKTFGRIAELVSNGMSTVLDGENIFW